MPLEIMSPTSRFGASLVEDDEAPIGSRFGASLVEDEPEQAKPDKISLFTKPQFAANDKVRELYDSLPDDHPRKAVLGELLTELDATAKPVAKGVMDASMGLPGFSDQPQFARRAVEGAAAVGAVLENVADRFLGRADDADTRRRTLETLRSYNEQLDKDSIFGKAVGPLVGSVQSALTQGTLAAPAGGLSAVSAMFGLQGADRAYVAAKDAGKSEGEAQLHGAIQGGIDGLITFAGGKLAGKLGVSSGETISPTVAKAVQGAAEKSGYTKIATTALLEAGENATQEFLTAVEAVRSGENPDAMKGIFKRVLTAAGTGAVAGSVAPALGELQSAINKFQTNLPDVVRGAAAAEQGLARNTVDPAQFEKPLTRKQFEDATGLKNTNKVFRDTYRETVLNASKAVDESSFVPGKEAPLESAGSESTPGDSGASILTPPAVADVATSARKVDVAADREQFDLPDLPEPERRSWQSALDVAKQNNVPNRAGQIAAEIATSPRPLTDVETAGMVMRAAELKNRHAELSTLAKSADAGDKKVAANELSRLQDEFDNLSGAIRVSGTEKGRALAAQKLAINQDYDLVSVQSRAKEAAGKKLTDAQREKLSGLVDEYNKHPAGSVDQDIARHKINRAVDDLRPKTVWGHIQEPFHLSLALITSFDLSAVLRQGGFVSFGHPDIAAKAFVPMLKAAASERSAAFINAEIQTRPNAPLYKKAGLFLHSKDSGVAGREESYMSRWAEKIPGVAASERAYTTFLNRLRADTFDMLSATLAKKGQPTLEESKAIANFVNVATGRGGLGKADGALNGLSTIFFAPRYTLSRFQLLAGQPLYGGTANTRKLIAGEYARYLIGIGGVYALASAAWGDDEAFSLSFDPRDANFGKIKLGNTRLDPLSGLAQTTRFAVQMTAGQTKDSHGRVQSLRGDDARFGNNALNVAGRFARTKLSPMAGAAANVIAGENVVGEPTTAGSLASDLFVPLSIKDIGKALEDQGLERGTIAGLLSMVGVGLQSYPPPGSEKPRMYQP